MVEQNSTVGSSAKTVVYIEAVMLEMVQKFLTNRREDVKIIKVAVAQADFQTIAKLGHNLKGAGTSYGFPTISAIGRNIQQAALAEQPDQILKHNSELLSYLDCVELAPID
jgi:HPt (histidine-containing phosphotransfer) domain-containing protein